MTPVLLEIFVGLAILVGLVGIVVPLLPGSITIFVAILVWAIVTSSGAGWAVLVAATALLVLGWSATYVFAGRRVKASGVPSRTIVVAGLAGIAGFFLVPVLGFFLFFPAALFGLEYLRLQDRTVAWASAWTAIKATALGMVVELGLALTASAVWLVAVIAGVGPG